MRPADRALLLDLDGTLADSLGVLRRAYHRFLAGYGKEGSEAEFRSLNGPPLPVVVDRLRQTHGLAPQTGQLLQGYELEIDRAYGDVPPMPGARDLLSQAKALGIATAVVTSNSRARAEAWLTAKGLAPLIDRIVGGDEVERGKPDPAPYLKALEILGLPAGRARAVEDSPGGAHAAVAAGVETFVCRQDGHGQDNGDWDDGDWDDGDWPPGVRFVRRLEEVSAGLKEWSC